MTKYLLLALAGTALAAAGAGWWALKERDARRDAEAVTEQLRAANEQLGVIVTTFQGIDLTLREQLEDVNVVPDTDTCGPRVDRALDLVRRGRADP